MTDADLTTANALKVQISKINQIQTLLSSATGEKAYVKIVNAQGNDLVSQNDLVKALGQGGYDTIAGTALSSINTALGSTLTSQQAAYDAL